MLKRFKGDSNNSVSPGCSLEGVHLQMLKMKLQYFGHLM